jgi:hypothetical protein
MPRCSCARSIIKSSLSEMHIRKPSKTLAVCCCCSTQRALDPQARGTLSHILLTINNIDCGVGQRRARARASTVIHLTCLLVFST